jgi:hypothetical protein
MIRSPASAMSQPMDGAFEESSEAPLLASGPGTDADGLPPRWSPTLGFGFRRTPPLSNSPESIRFRRFLDSANALDLTR